MTKIFRKLIYDNLGNYNYYVIMPANLKGTEQVIENLPTDKVYILDQTHRELMQYAGIYQNFEKDIYENLTKGIERIKKYKKLVLLFDQEKQPKGILKGFKLFCKTHKLDSEIVHSFENRIIQKGEILFDP